MALIGQTRIDAGEFGLYGFPVIALLFATVMTFIEKDKHSEKDTQASIDRKFAELEEKIRQLKTEQMTKGPDQFNM
jgi:hypothetical protein